MGLNIVTNSKIVDIFKRSNLFVVSLGMVSTIDKNGNRILNDADRFAYFYNNQYRTTIMGKGNIGDIRFYMDSYIVEDVIAVYYGQEFQEFVFEFDARFIKEKGINAYLGKILKDCDDGYEELKKKDELKKLEPVAKGDPYKVINSPGQATYADIVAYMEAKKRGQL
jgi:hypothetical protein